MSARRRLLAAGLVLGGAYAAGLGVGAAARARLRRDAQAAWQAAHTDPLTGLPNRAGLARQLAERVEAGCGFWLTLWDLDGFKSVNDLLGHDVGDQVLTEVGRRLAGVVPAGGFAARLGGDEFVLLWPEMAPHRIEPVLVEARQQVAEPMLLDRRWMCTWAAVGATHTSGGEPPSPVLGRADVAMYRAKRTGAGVGLFDPDEDQVDQPDPARDGRPVVRARDLSWLPRQRSGAVVPV